MPLYEGIGLINEKHPVVLDIGSVYTKAGFAGEPSPRCILHSRVRRSDARGYQNLTDYKDTTELYQMFVDFLQFLYCKHLLVTPKDRKVVIIESVFSPTGWRETLARVLYFHYEVLNVLWLPSHLAAVCVTGSDTGLFIDIGHEEATVIPVFKGVTVLNAVQAFELGAKKFDLSLKTKLEESCEEGPENLSELLDDEKLEDIRVRACFVSSRPEKPPSFAFEINGDNFLNFKGDARVDPAEIWFCNEDLDGESLPSMVLNSLAKCPIDTRKPLARSILLAGGTLMLPGFRKRLLKDLNVLAATRNLNLIEPIEFRVFNLPTQENCVSWLGGSIYGATEAMNLRGFTKESFLKTGVVPDWSNLAYNSFHGFTSGTNTPTASPSKSL